MDEGCNNNKMKDCILESKLAWDSPVQLVKLRMHWDETVVGVCDKAPGKVRKIYDALK